MKKKKSKLFDGGSEKFTVPQHVGCYCCLNLKNCPVPTSAKPHRLKGGVPGSGKGGLKVFKSEFSRRALKNAILKVVVLSSNLTIPLLFERVQ